MNKRNITDFTEKEYKQQAQNKNFQSIASYVSGLKPTANKVIYTIFKNNVSTWTKVEDIASTTSLLTKYLGGATNISGVTINIARNYIGSNNLSLLAKKGDFGGRLKDVPGAPRYIFTKKSPIFDKLFNKEDLNVLPRYSFEGDDIEYRFFTFHLPMLLVNGSEGMGSGHAQKILPRNPLELIKELKNKLNGKNYKIPDVYYNGYNGEFIKKSETQWLIKGSFERKSITKTMITEIPIVTSVDNYRKFLDKLVDKKVILDWDDLCDPQNDKILFELKHSKDISKLSDDEMLDKFNLVSSETENFTCINEKNRIRVFDTAKEVFDAFCEVKLEYIEKSKQFKINLMKDDLAVLESKVIFIKNVIDNTIEINNKKKSEIVKSIKGVEGIITIEGNYDYLLRMPLYSLTSEKIKELNDKIKAVKSDITRLQKTEAEDIWLGYLNELEKVL